MPKRSVQVGRPVRRVRRRRVPIRRRVRRVARVPRLLPRASRVQVFKRTVNSSSLILWAPSLSPSGATLNPNASGLLAVGSGSLQQTYYASLGLGFKIEDVPGYTDITADFERYKIVGIRVRCVPVYNVTEAPGAVTTPVVNGSFGGFIHTCIDYDDYNPLTASQVGIDAMAARPSYRLHKFTRGFSRVFKPRIASNVYSGPANPDGYVSVRPPYIHNNSPDVEHYGMKVIWEMFNPLPASMYFNFKFQVDYYIMAQGPIV